MNYGFLRTAAVAPVIKVADTEYNSESIIECAKKAYADGVKLAVFPELCVTGYTCGDLFLHGTLIKGAEKAVERIAEATQNIDMIIIVGLPVVKGAKLYNCAAVLLRGELLGIVPKTNLPNYAESYEARQFTPAPEGVSEITFNGETVPFGSKLIFCCDSFKDFVFGVEISEDMTVPASPSQGLARAGAVIIANPSACDEIVGRADYTRLICRAQSGKLCCAYICAGAGEGESTTDVVYSGHRIICENGTVLSESGLFENGITADDVDVERLISDRIKMNIYPETDRSDYYEVHFSMDTELKRLTRKINNMPFIPAEANRAEELSLILKIQAAGLKKRLAHANAKTAVIGISGGLDSTLALICAANAMDALSRPRTDIIAVTMPCFGTTKRTKSNAEKLCEKLGVSFREVNITNSVKSHFDDIGHAYDAFDVTFENAQARERTQVIMDIANMNGGMVIGTGDLSELALGWATYNGDHMSMYGVNASISKTLVRYLVRHYAETCGDGELEATLIDILDTPVSPELLPAKVGEISQKTEGIVGPYELHDFFLYYFIRFGFSHSKIRFLAEYAFKGIYDGETVEKWLETFMRRFFIQQFKRSCVPDGIKVGSVALSPRGDWRMPSDAVSKLWLEDLK